MNNLNNSVDEPVECPLCMEPLEVDDLNFFPCTCGYQICRFCWHRIRTDENELCPACRKEYPENPADFKPLTQEEMIAFKSQKRQRDQQRKQKITENRKHLANVRVVQKNLVFVVGLPPRLADADTLRKHEYFGKYGKIHKVVINPSTTYAGVQGPSASAYVTYIHNTDALRAIQSVNNIMIDGRLIKTSLGTTKYCSHFMKNQQCPKADCMYLHELGDPEASFTKEEMHQGKHQEYEKRLHDVLIASSTGCGVFNGNPSILNSSGKNCESKMISEIKMTASSSSSVPVSTASVSLCSTTNNTSSTAIAPTPQKEAWPSLSISPVNQKDSTSNNCNKNRKERVKQEKSKVDKISKPKNNKSNNNNTLNPLPKEIDLPVIIDSFSTNNNCLSDQIAKSKCDKSKERNQHSLVNRSNPKKELVLLAPAENEIKGFEKNVETVTSTSLDLSKSGEYLSNRLRNDNIEKTDRLRSLSSSSNDPLINENESVKSSSCSFNEENMHDECIKAPVKCKLALTPSSELDKIQSNIDSNNLSENFSNSFGYVNSLFEQSKNAAAKTNINNNFIKNVYFKEPTDNNRYEKTSYNELLQKETEGEDYTTDTMAKLNLGDENSFFSSPSRAIHSSMALHRKHNEEIVPNQLSSGTVPNLPDLINGIEGYQNSTNDFQSNSNSYLTNFDLSRQSTYLQYQQQPGESSKDNMQNSLFGTNMSKFFDFHKHQQMKLQNCLKINGQNNINGGVNESLHMMPTIENNRLNSKMIDPNCNLISQQQKQKPFCKMDRLICHQTFQQIPNQQITSIQSHQHQYTHSSACDDDLGFDPFMETQKALAELIENEEEQNLRAATPKLINQKQVNSVNQPHMIEYIHRSRLPPPGFNHVNSFTGYGVVPRVQDNKVVSFMNLSTNYAAPTAQHIQQQQQQQQLQISSNAWGGHLGNFQQHIDQQQVRQINSNQMSGAVNQKGYTGNDWTAMDPAILSLRQFPFPHQTSQIHPQQQDIFLQQLTHQQQPGFTSQSQHLSGGSAAMPNTIINSQQNSQTQVNANVQGMLEYLKTRQFV